MPHPAGGWGTPGSDNAEPERQHNQVLGREPQPLGPQQGALTLATEGALDRVFVFHVHTHETSTHRHAQLHSRPPTPGRRHVQTAAGPQFPSLGPVELLPDQAVQCCLGPTGGLAQLHARGLRGGDTTVSICLGL